MSELRLGDKDEKGTPVSFPMGGILDSDAPFAVIAPDFERKITSPSPTCPGATHGSCPDQSLFAPAVKAATEAKTVVLVLTLYFKYCGAPSAGCESEVGLAITEVWLG